MAAPTVAPSSAAPPPPAPAPRPRRSLTGRALLALAFLTGFYLLAFAVVAALVVANVLVFTMAERVQYQLVLLTGVVGWAVLKGVFFVAKVSHADLPGIPVDPAREPGLTDLVRSVAKDMGTEPPHRILLVPEVNAYVTQTGGMLGLRPGERVMTLGVALVDSLTVDQLRAVVAHELGHYAGGDTRLGPLTYRAGASIYRTVDHLGHDTLLGRLFAAYGARYLVISQRVRRGQELSADAAAIWLAGRENLTSGLRRTEATGAAFSHLIRTYLAPLWQQGADAANAFDGFRRLLADPDRQAQLAEVEEAATTQETDPLDSHPSLRERVAAAGAAPEGPTAGLDGRPARALLRHSDDIERQVSRLLTTQITGERFERLVDWDDPDTAVLFGGGVREAADALLRAAAGVAGDPDRATLATVVELIEAGRAGELAAALTDDPDERADALRSSLGCALATYLVAERGHAWAVSWSGALTLADPKGKAKDAWALADAFLADPATGGRLRRSLGGTGRLAAFAAAPRAEGEGDGDRPATGPELVAVAPDVALGRKPTDLVISTEALVFHPVEATVAHGLRMAMAAQGFAGQAQAATRRRLEGLFDQGPEFVLGATAPKATVVPLATVVAVRPRGSKRIQVDVARGGASATLKLGFQTKGQRNEIVADLNRVRTPPAA